MTVAPAAGSKFVFPCICYSLEYRVTAPGVEYKCKYREDQNLWSLANIFSNTIVSGSASVENPYLTAESYGLNTITFDTSGKEPELSLYNSYMSLVQNKWKIEAQLIFYERKKHGKAEESWMIFREFDVSISDSLHSTFPRKEIRAPLWKCSGNSQSCPSTDPEFDYLYLNLPGLRLHVPHDEIAFGGSGEIVLGRGILKHLSFTIRRYPREGVLMHNVTFQPIRRFNGYRRFEANLNE